jgi:hypothetical protein
VSISRFNDSPVYQFFETFPLPSEGEDQCEGVNFTPTFILPPQGGGKENSQSFPQGGGIKKISRQNIS